MARTLPDSLKKKQEEQRQETANKVQEAIDIIIEECGIVTKKKIKTGASAGSKAKIADTAENKLPQTVQEASPDTADTPKQ